MNLPVSKPLVDFLRGDPMFGFRITGAAYGLGVLSVSRRCSGAQNLGPAVETETAACPCAHRPLATGGFPCAGCTTEPNNQEADCGTSSKSRTSIPPNFVAGSEVLWYEPDNNPLRDVEKTIRTCHPSSYKDMHDTSHLRFTIFAAQ